MQSKPPVSKDRRRDKLVGLLIIVLSFAGCMGLSLWGMSVSTPKPAPTPLPPSLERLPGFPDKVDPFALVERAAGLSVRSKFRGFVATGVLPDGTLNLNSKKASLRYAFQDPSGLGHQPPREGGTLPQRRYCGLQSVFVKKQGISAAPDAPERACPTSSPESLPIPEACTLEDIWEIATARRINPSEAARIEYYEALDGPAFRFKQDRHTFIISAKDCKTVLSTRSGRGLVP